MQWKCVSGNLSKFQSDELETVQFWIDGVCQFIIGSIGIISNILAILILLRSRMIESSFNKLLTCLLIFHSIYIACEMLTEIIHPSWSNDTEQIAEIAFTIYLAYLLRPLGILMRYSSTFFTALMARERYLASCNPIQYRNSVLTRNCHIYLIKNVMLVFLTSALFTFPIYLETSIDDWEIGKVHDLNATHFKYVSSTYKDIIYKWIINYICFFWQNILLYNIKTLYFH
jgi:hypothetical protein